MWLEMLSDAFWGWAIFGQFLPSSQTSLLCLGHSFWVKCGLDKNLKSETNCLTFSPSRFRLAGGNSLSISGRGIAREKHFKLVKFKGLFGSKWAFIESETSPLSNYSLQANNDHSKHSSTVVLDQRITKIYRITQILVSRVSQSSFLN